MSPRVGVAEEEEVVVVVMDEGGAVGVGIVVGVEGSGGTGMVEVLRVVGCGAVEEPEMTGQESGISRLSLRGTDCQEGASLKS